MTTRRCSCKNYCTINYRCGNIQSAIWFEHL